MNASRLLDIDLDYGTAISATRYDLEGYGSSYWGTKWLTEHYPVEHERWPCGNDWPRIPCDQEVEATRLWNAFRDRLLDGWVAISGHHWDDVYDHAIVFSEYKDSKITVLCSVRGMYEIDRDWLKWKDWFQPVIFTEWLRVTPTAPSQSPIPSHAVRV